MICQTAPEERPETCSRFAADFRPAGDILTILLILSKNLGESMRCANETCCNCLPTQNSEAPVFYNG
jgi:hypothetical protein